MKQIFHIFAKDSRHFWPEILVSLAVLAAFTLSTPHQWAQPAWLTAASGFGALSFPEGSLALIVVVTWWLLIARVVHDESLVGDRQFWLTRPYVRSRLLAAKALFLLVYLYVPFVVAKLVLLDRAGFAPLSYFPGLLLNLLLVTASVVVPLFAIATVTANFARLVLAVLGVLLCFIAILVATSTYGKSLSFPYGFLIPLIPCVCVAVIGLQYATRRLWLSRSLLIGYPLLILTTSFVGESQATMDRSYPPANDSMHLAYAQDSPPVATVSATQDGTVVQLSVPIESSGVANGHMWMSRNLRASIEAPGHPSWTSRWLSMPPMHFVPGSQQSTVFFTIKRSVLQGFRGIPVTLHLWLGFDDMQAGEPRRVALQTSAFPIPDFGICAPQVGWDGTQQITGVVCRSPLRPPPFTYVETVWSSKGACPSSTTNQADGVKGDAWVGSWDHASAEFGISPIWLVGIPFSNNVQANAETNAPQKLRHLCPGTLLTFTRYDAVRRLRADLTIPGFRFPQ